jgi:hypothetical protein
MPGHLRSATVRSSLSLILTFLLGFPLGSPLGAQQEPPVGAKLNIVVIGGEGAINNLRHRTASAPIVQVEDENRRPVAEAAVLFMLPDSGPGGVFANGARSLLVRTDNAGRASAKGLRANDTQGKFQIRVQASFRGTTATTSITQENSILTGGAGTGDVSRKLIVILAAVGAAVAVGVIVATLGRGGTESTPTISPGSPTVGGPQ